MPALAKRMNEIKGSATSAVVARVTRLRQQGVKVLSLNVGEPDFPTPDYIRDAAAKDLAETSPKYTTAAGLLPLRQAVAEKLLRDNHVAYQPDEIAIVAGAKQALYCALMAIAGPGDEIIIVTPCYVSYPEMVRMTGATPVLVPTTQGNYQLDADAIQAAVTERTKAVIICTPCNPTGSVYKEADLRALAALAVEKDFFVIADEIYEKIVYDENRHFSIASVSPEMRNLTITINGWSKSHAMTGWRIGYVAAAQPVTKAITSLISQTTTCASDISQKAAIVAEQGSQEATAAMVQEYQQRRDYVVNRIRSMPGLTCPDIEGTFYVLFDMTAYLGKTIHGHLIESDVDFCNCAIEEAHVAMVPGTPFEAPGCVRIAFCTSMEILRESMDALESMLQ